MQMATLQILDIVVRLPQGTSWTTDTPEECRITHNLDGPSVQEVRTALEKEATKLGYNLRQINRISYLRRGERRIEIYDMKPAGLEIRVDDAEALPLAHVVEQGIRLAGITLPIPKGARVEPGRERHDPGSTSWSAEWRMYDCAADKVASLMHDSLTQMGLRPGGVWPPPIGGIPRWKAEAFSAHQLVQADITDAGDHLDLILTVIGPSDD